MISAIQFIDYDVSKLIEIYIEIYKQRKIIINELKDNIIFTTHINYYKKYFRSKNLHLKDMLTNKTETIHQIKNLIGKKGWIVDYPTKFNWDISKYIKISREMKIEEHNNNLLLKDKKTGWQYRNYPPHSRHYNSKDLLKNIKL